MDPQAISKQSWNGRVNVSGGSLMSDVWRLDWIDVWLRIEGPVEGSCEHGNGPSGSTKC
jgi:hypothetical protein